MWIKCTEKLPEVGLKVLVYAEGGLYIADFDMGRWFIVGNDNDLEVTHWMKIRIPDFVPDKS